MKLNLPNHIMTRLSYVKHFLFIFAAIILVCFNVSSLTRKSMQMGHVRAQTPYIFVGFKFSGLEDVLKDIQHIGYYTDKNMDDRQNALQFAQAQYILAPVILDLNNTAHEYILFDCSDENVAWQKIREVGASPLKKRFGIILVRQPKYQVKDQ